MLNLLKSIISMRKGNICLWGKKRPLVPNVSSQQESRWLSSIRLKAQRTAISFVILEKRNQFKIRKLLATTDGIQYEICSDVKLSFDCAYS